MDQICINAIRTLAMDAVQAANSGHPGTSMAMAPVAYCLWQEFLTFDLADVTFNLDVCTGVAPMVRADTLAGRL